MWRWEHRPGRLRARLDKRLKPVEQADHIAEGLDLKTRRVGLLTGVARLDRQQRRGEDRRQKSRD